LTIQYYSGSLSGSSSAFGIVRLHKLELDRLTAENSDLKKQLKLLEVRERTAYHGQEKALMANKQLMDKWTFFSIQMTEKNEKLAGINEKLTERYRESAVGSSPQHGLGKDNNSASSIEGQATLSSGISNVGVLTPTSVSTYINNSEPTSRPAC
jgi:hypothetical protein